MAIRRPWKWPLPAAALGVATFGHGFAAQALDGPENMQHEIVVTARATDEALTEKVSVALQQDPYLFTDHVTVTTVNGVVRVGGIVHDLSDLFAILRVARRTAGKGRVVNEIEFVPIDDDGN